LDKNHARKLIAEIVRNYKEMIYFSNHAKEEMDGNSAKHFNASMLSKLLK
jgi:hypothetical protein